MKPQTKAMLKHEAKLAGLALFKLIKILAVIPIMIIAIIFNAAKRS
jgi:hypothetical protein